MKRFFMGMTVLALGAACLQGCAAGEQTASRKAEALQNSTVALAAFKERDPSLTERINSSYGYAIFPSVGKGGIGVGGAYGSGVVFEQGEAIGNTTLSQATIGLQLGGQEYRELILLENRAALNDFTSGNFEFAAQVSAVAADAGASADADFNDGMMIFTMQVGGLMYEASVGGQKFSFNRYDD